MDEGFLRIQSFVDSNFKKMADEIVEFKKQVSIDFDKLQKVVKSSEETVKGLGTR